MDEPEGYRAPIHLVLTRGTPRRLLMGTAMFCLGLGMVCKSWGAGIVYLIAHGTMAYLTWRDPYWPQIAKEAITYAIKLRTRRLYIVQDHRLHEVGVVLIVAGASIGFVILVMVTVRLLTWSEL